MFFSKGGWLLVRRWAIVVCLGYLCLLVMMWWIQRSLIFYATKSDLISESQPGFPKGTLQTVEVKTADNLTLKGWHALHGQNVNHQEIKQGETVMLCFGGNGGHRQHRVNVLAMLAQLPAHVFLYDYRGYAENPGAPSEKACVADARAAWDDLINVKGCQPEQIIIFGESLGGGVACQLAAQLASENVEPAGLIVKSSFSSLVDVSAYHYKWLPVRYLLVDTFYSDRAVKKLTCPILVIHGTRDDTVPVSFGKKLFTAAPEKSRSGIAKQFVELPNAGHNDVLSSSPVEFRKAILNFIIHPTIEQNQTESNQTEQNKKQ